MRRSVTALTALGTLVVALLTVQAPAQGARLEAPAPAFSALDTTVPGQVTFTLTTPAPYAFVQVTTGHTGWTKVTVEQGVATVTLDTWGHSWISAVAAVACMTDNRYGDCSYETRKSLAPNNPVPQVTWSSDTTIGPGDKIAITISDPDGGGALVATWPDHNNTRQFPLDRAGTTLVEPGESHHTEMRIERCSTVTVYTCTGWEIPVLKKYDVRLESYGSVVGEGRENAVVPSNLHAPVTRFWVRTPEVAPTTSVLTWSLRDIATQQTVAGFGGTVTATNDTTGRIGPIDIDGSTLPEGRYQILGSYEEDSPEFGHLSGAFGNGELVVDRTPNTAASAFAAVTPTIYPLVHDYGYRGSTSFSVSGKGPAGDDQVEIRSSAGKVVAVADLSWGGYDFDGKLVPAGGYSATLVDPAGNRAPGVAPVTVTVSHKRLYRETFTRTVSALASLDDKYVGRCSTLRSPSLRKWKGSLGYYANTRCKTQTGKASGISTLHAVQLPPAAKYASVQVALYGGGATARKRSRVILSYLRTNGKWNDMRAFTGRMGVHKGEVMYTRRAPNSPYVFSDRYLAWGVFTGYKQRYDVKSFTVTVNYLVVR